MAADEARPYLIWSEEHRAWWRPDRCGYSQSLRAAGRYSQEEAEKIAQSANAGGSFCEIAVRAPDDLTATLNLRGAGR